jgi:hypothetical protein
VKFTARKRPAALIAAGVAVLAIGLSACNNNGNSESAAQSADSTALETNQPLPHVTWSQERENLIDIELAEVNDVQTTTFVMHNGDQNPINSCPSIGFGIPDSASLSNPLKPDSSSGTYAGDVVGQEDPNGIYAPTSSEGTFVICLDSTGQPYINRVEDDVDTVGGPAQWNDTTHSYSLIGAPTAIAHTAPASAKAATSK